MKTVTVIVPVYNAEKGLSRCIESILSQDYRDIDLLLINDGSKDSSKEIMDSYAAKDSRVRCIHKENEGVSATRNRGIAEAKGDYIQFVDADDFLPYESIKLLVRQMEEDDTDLVVGDFYRVVNDTVTKKGSIAKGGIYETREYADKMLLTPADFYYGVLWNKLYRRDLIEKYHIRMDEKISYSEDMIFNLEYLLHVQTISILKVPVYYYVKTEGSLVDQNMSLSSIIKMKSSVIGYYNNFYKHILDEDDYEERRPIIYGYLLSFSTDGFSVPILSDSKPLGKERGYLPEESTELSSSFISYSYLSSTLTGRYLKTLSDKYALDLKQMKILYLLYLKNNATTVEDLAAYLSVGKMDVLLALPKLLSGRYIKLEVENLLEENGTRYSLLKENEELLRDLKAVGEDYASVIYEGFNEEEIDAYRKAEKKIAENLRNALK